MKFENPLIEGVLIKRYKRFLADVRLSSGETILAHVPNSGSMKGVSDPGSPCFISRSSVSTRKIPYTLEMVKAGGSQWVGVNTSLTNRLIQEAFENKIIPDWERYSDFRREVKINKESRLDFLLTNSESKHYVEVKNVSMARPPWAVFPDAKTERGQKHLKELSLLLDKGVTAEIFFVVQREDCAQFSPADEIDPIYGKLLREVTQNGVLAQCWACTISPQEIRIDRPLKLSL